ncbi:MAG: beta-carotene 15,15'-monooxygenase [Streptococcus peroris]|uniref:beta-carotene 15,15'-monooxygenase n=1 Tax=Streptococcus peroris TaxID=68891 RepID=UPI002907BD2C|nr:beta-carotene 15,15'-monooxygenase [Streptococcus peroris]MDU7074834.1 beta-carotene 15,15'-monooxygenase [Streptococcus peroris]
MKINTNFKKITNIFYGVVFYLTSAILSLLILSSLFFTVYIPLSIKEKIEFYNSTWYFPIVIFLFVFVLFKSKKLVEKFSSNKLFLILSVTYLIVGIFLIYRLVGGLRADAYYVYQAAKEFNSGVFDSLTNKGGYLYIYPHQLGLTSLERIYVSLYDNEKMFYFINLLFILGTNFYLSKISLKLFKSQLVTNYSIILSFLFFPHFFFLTFVYGTIPGLFLMVFGYYHLLKYNETSRYYNVLLSILSFALACLIRNNFYIFVIAIILIQIFSFLENIKWRKVIITSLIVISIPTSSYLLKKYYQNVTHNPIPQGVPMISFVTMGTQDNPNVPTLGGWWDGYNTSVLVENDFDQSKAVQQAKSDLKENLRTFYKQPKYALKFFYKKILSTWLEPTFQSIWTGPLTEKGNIQNSRILKSIYEEKSGYYFLNSFGKVFTVSIYLLALIAVIYYIISKKFSVFELFTIIFFLGGFFFHLLWETKSQYVFIYVLLLIPTAANGLDKITSILYKKGVISNSN